MKSIFILAFILPIQILAQFAPNSIGLAHLIGQSEDSYDVIMIFPDESVEGLEVDWNKDISWCMDSIDFDGEIVLFDSIGKLVSIHIQDKVYLAFWCENDGGTQYRPTLRCKIPKTDFTRPLQANKEFLNMIGFAVAEKTEFKSQKLKETEFQTVMSADLDGDGTVDCKLLTYYDEAENCDHEPQNNMTLELQVKGKIISMRCCGP